MDHSTTLIIHDPFFILLRDFARFQSILPHQMSSNLLQEKIMIFLLMAI